MTEFFKLFNAGKRCGDSWIPSDRKCRKEEGDETKSKPGGKTLKDPDAIKTGALMERLKQGGFTYQPVSRKVPSKGLVVALPHAETIFDADTVNTGTLQRFVDDHMKDFRSNPNVYFGGWFDTAAKRIYLDVVEVLDNKNEAIKKAKERNQEAIYDIGTGKTVFTKEQKDRRFLNAAAPSAAPLKHFLFPRSASVAQMSKFMQQMLAGGKAKQTLK